MRGILFLAQVWLLLRIGGVVAGVVAGVILGLTGGASR